MALSVFMSMTKYINCDIICMKVNQCKNKFVLFFVLIVRLALLRNSRKVQVVLVYPVFHTNFMTIGQRKM